MALHSALGSLSLTFQQHISFAQQHLREFAALVRESVPIVNVCNKSHKNARIVTPLTPLNQQPAQAHTRTLQF